MEKTVDLKMPITQELDKNDLAEIDGGSILGGIAVFVGASLLGAATVEIIVDGSAQCWKDFKEGYSSTQ